MMHQEGIGQSLYIRQVAQALVFNAVPLALLLGGWWNAFEVMAFYWMEVIAAGIMALLIAVVSFIGNICSGRIREALRHFPEMLFMPVHFGFFMVMTCFLVGSFLPEGTPTQPLSSPLVPLQMVMHYIRFAEVFPVVLFWEAVTAGFDMLYARRHPSYKLPHPVGIAYGRLAILFISGFFGLFIAMNMNDRIWGGVLLIVLKTVCAVIAVLFKKRKDSPAA